MYLIPRIITPWYVLVVSAWESIGHNTPYGFLVYTFNCTLGIVIRCSLVVIGLSVGGWVLIFVYIFIIII